MSDKDTGKDTAQAAWHQPPSRYLESRPPLFEAIPAPRSVYVAMQDGCRLAVDFYLPQPDAAGTGDRVPAILILTPYYRRFKLADDGKGTEPSPNAGRYRDFFVRRGYAVVVVDVRGTGASFGTRDSFRSPQERDDFGEIAEWVVRQPWSNGVIGATGISYPGAASDFLASTGHPSVKAIAPLFAVWDTYSDHYYPGGILLNRLAETYDRLMVALDHDRRDLLGQFAYYSDPNLAGPQPVDEDADGSLCRAAVQEHIGNFHMPDFITEFRFKDDTLPYDPSFSSSAFSPYHYAAGIREDVAVYSVSGWMDGAGYANGSISRFLTLPNRNRHLLLGPWDHGARINVSPWRDAVEPQFMMLAEILRFFDHYLMGLDTGLQHEAPVHYFSLRSETWQAAAQWPPVEQSQTFFLAGDAVRGTELATAPPPPGEASHQVDFAAGTGAQTRYERIAAIDAREYYTDWQGRDEAMLRYTSAPLAATMELTGHPVVTLFLSANQPDAAVHVYLSEVEADGRVRYVTEGVLRALHRKEAENPVHHATTWPFRNFSRADAAPLQAGRPEKLRFALLPTSWIFQKGSRVRLAIAGADIDHFVQIPHGRPPRLTLHHGGPMASALELPWRVDTRTA